jgi:Family of unknown function (DUF6152)
MNKRLSLLVFFVLFVVEKPVVFAHHGGGSFDLSKSVTYDGVLARVELVNPHSWLYFDVTDANGKVSHHRCEMRSVHVLRRSGWNKEQFPVGKPVTVEAAPDKIDPNSCYLNTIRFKDGTHMDRYGQYVKGAGGALTEVRGAVTTPNVSSRAAKLPSGEPNITGDWAPEQVVMANPRGTGGGLVPLSRLKDIDAAGGPQARGGGRRGAPAGPRLYGGSELTDAGTEAAAKFQQMDNPRFHCETTSIIFDWTFDGPVNRITQKKDTIEILYGQMGLKRTIYMNMKDHPASVKPTRAGHSIGHWEGDTLVVDTARFLPGVLNAPVRNSDKLHVVERFTLDPKTMQITRTYDADDPVYLKGIYKGRDVIGVADQSYTQDHCKEQGFINYSQQVKK